MHADRIAIIDDRTGREYTYSKLLQDSERVAKALLQKVDREDLEDICVAFLSPPSYEYCVIQWAIWRAGGIAVPMCVAHSQAELRYVIEDSKSLVALSHTAHCEQHLKGAASSASNECVVVGLEGILSSFSSLCTQLPTHIKSDRRALIIYTSGTTGAPKGVVTTHRSLQAQITSLVDAWRWSANDVIMNVLPLHHVHGVVNVVACALWSGATCEMTAKFDADMVWNRVCGDCTEENRQRDRRALTLFMAVPTVYAKLVDAWEKMSDEEQRQSSNAFKKLRLAVSGSAALPQTLFERWQRVGGHSLLERYGMTEIGMCLSNPYEPVEHRHPGCVGLPLPGVRVRIVGDSGEDIDHPGKHEQTSSPGESDDDDGTNSGELRVKGPTVFQEYWGRPEATASEFDDEGWFKTGDIAAYDHARHTYRILGRASADIIKCGGYKLSALEIERVLLEHERIRECAVVGLDDDHWGQRVAAQVVLTPVDRVGGGTMSLQSLRLWCADHLAKYKIPSELKVADEIPKNAMGKVNKRDLVRKW